MKQYYFKSEDGNEYGPITAEEISDWQAQGRMNSGHSFGTPIQRLDAT